MVVYSNYYRCRLLSLWPYCNGFNIVDFWTEIGFIAATIDFLNIFVGGWTLSSRPFSADVDEGNHHLSSSNQVMRAIRITACLRF